MRPIIKNKVLYIPMRAESENGDLIGDGMIPIGEDHPDYDKWYEEYKKKIK